MSSRPDEGRVKKVRRIAGRLGCPLAVGYKTHPEHGVSDITHLAGDVRGKTCIVYDDMISSGGSINEIVDALLKNGAKPDITVATTHALLVGKSSGETLPPRNYRTGTDKHDSPHKRKTPREDDTTFRRTNIRRSNSCNMVGWLGITLV